MDFQIILQKTPQETGYMRMESGCLIQMKHHDV
jgi:hypothetical protein